MRRRLITTAAIAAGISIATVLLATPALAKGPTQARITGPGLVRAVVVSGQGEPGGQDQLATLAGQTGLFTVLFGAFPGEPALTSLRRPPPSGSLGPKYTLIYTVPGVTSPSGQASDRIRQDLYPDAAGGPVVYTAPGQPGYGAPTKGTAWLRGGPRLLRTLGRLGVPFGTAGQAGTAQSTGTAQPTGTARPAAKTVPSASRQTTAGISAWLLATIAVVAAAALSCTALWVRRRRLSGG